MRASPTPTAVPTTVVWYRSALRVSDHPALTEAARRGAVVPLFLWAPEEDGEWAPGGAHRWWLRGSLAALDGALRERGSRLTVRRGPSLGALRRVLAETEADAVYAVASLEPAARRRDEETARRLRAGGVEVRFFPGRLLHDPDRVQTGSGGPYRVYSPFWRKFKEEVEVGPPLPAPDLAGAAPAAWPESLAVDDLALDAVDQDGVDWAGGMREAWTPGEAPAHDRLRAFLDERLGGYTEDRNQPAVMGTSSIEPHLRWGEISPRQVWAAVRERAEGAGEEAVEKYLSEIAWREFSYHVLHHSPESPTAPLNASYRDFPHRDSEEDLLAWRRGQTGYPYVDAGMRQLWALGWMHNRVRMTAASFLTKDLLVRWQDGARYFWDTLCGADLANNTMGWQWAAGSGADAQPFFRIFNPVSQSQKHDPSGDYVRRWVPELADLPDKHLHAPWEAPEATLRKAGVELGRTYPAPIVVHAEARDRALAALAEMRGGGE